MNKILNEEITHCLDHADCSYLFFPCMLSYHILFTVRESNTWLMMRREMKPWIFNATVTCKTHSFNICSLVTGNSWDIDRFLLFLLLTSCLRLDIASTLMTKGDISIYNYTFKRCNYAIQNNCFKMLFEYNYLEGNPSLPYV